jgi:hypothetical protein
MQLRNARLVAAVVVAAGVVAWSNAGTGAQRLEDGEKCECTNWLFGHQGNWYTPPQGIFPVCQKTDCWVPLAAE